MSGTWALLNTIDAPAGAARELSITQDQKSFTVRASAGTFPQSRTVAIGLIGGTVSSTGDRTEVSALATGDVLTIESTQHMARPAAPDESLWRAEVWSAGGDRLTVHVTERRGDRTVLDTTLVYRRR